MWSTDALQISHVIAVIVILILVIYFMDQLHKRIIIQYGESVAPAEADVGTDLPVQQEDPQLDEFRRRPWEEDNEDGEGFKWRDEFADTDSGDWREKEKRKRGKKKMREVPKEPDGNTIAIWDCHTSSTPTHTASLPPNMITF